MTELIKRLLLIGIGLQTLLARIEAQDFGGPTQSQIEAAQEFDRTLRPFLDQVRVKNRLKYGESCDYSLEESRQELGKSFVTSLATVTQSQANGIQVNPAEVNQRVLQNFKSLASLRGNFCSVFENLLCNSSSRCDCARMDYDHGVQITFIREEDTCVLAPGSTCPANQSPQSNNNDPDGPGSHMYSANQFQTHEAKCSQTAPCKLKSSGKFCSLQNAQAEISAIMKSVGGSTDSEDRDTWVRQKLQEGICTCGGMGVIGSSAASVLLISSFAFLLSQF